MNCDNITSMKHKRDILTCDNSLQNTTDIEIRTLLRAHISNELANYPHRFRVIEELGVNHGNARIDIAVINGVMHGYEIKSDLDTFYRLSAQITAYNAIFDEMTIVVGLSHLLAAIEIVPDWWGVMVARKLPDGKLKLNTIRSSEKNAGQDLVAVSRLLWRDEALSFLEDVNAAAGVRAKSRGEIYSRLVNSVDGDLLKERVRNVLCERSSWRVA